MGPDGLRPATAKAATTTSPKLATRLSKGEKRNRRRMAEVGATYDTTPTPRTPADILAGSDTRVASNLRRAATRAGLEPAQRASSDTCAKYLANKRAYLDYPTALRQGWPIATGIIEGACRHLVRDRMDLTGARWGLHGAEAALKLRARRCNGDFETYWRYHLGQEHRRAHQSRYADNTVPKAA